MAIHERVENETSVVGTIRNDVRTPDEILPQIEHRTVIKFLILSVEEYQ